MKSYELKPTYENLLSTYLEDTIGRNADVFRFTSILNSISDSYSIALDGNWGSGKTFFVKQVKMVLDAHNSFIESKNDVDNEKIKGIRTQYYQNAPEMLQPQVCIYYDAWENDNDDDPILSLVYTILNNVNTDYTFKNIDCVKTAGSIMEVFSGRNWSQLIDSLKGDNPLASLQKTKNVEKMVGEFLNTLLPEKGNRLIVLIDELDRCKPSYAVKLLERIKHYFSNDKITFVFSINTNELQHTIRKHYGADFDGSRYLERFFDLRVSLPPPDLQRYFLSLNFNDSHYTYDIVCGAVIKAYHFELREIAKYLSLAKIAAYTPTHDSSYGFHFPEGRALQFSLLYIVPIMIGLKVSDTKLYSAFINGKNYEPLIEMSESLGTRFFEELLENNESYDDQDTSKSLVTLEAKLKAVYEALFVGVSSEEVYRTRIGKMSFDNGTKNTLLRVTGLLSQYTSID